MWLVMKQKVPTMDNLLEKGWSDGENCVFCLSSSETMDHPFGSCLSAKPLLEVLLPNKRYLTLCSSISWLWDDNKIKGDSLERRELATVVTTWWVIWLEQNCRIFQDTKHSPGYLLAKIHSLREQWDHFCVN